MKDFIRLLRFIYPLCAVLFIGSVFTGAYLQDRETSNSNSFTAATWTPSPTPTPANVIINEVLSNGSEWIELYYSAGALSLADYTIEDNTSIPKDLSAYSIPAGGYLVLTQGVDFSFILNNPGDILTLKKSGSTVDKMSYGNYNDGNILDNAPVPSVGESVARIPNGTDTNNDLADFQILTTPTAGSSNG